MSTRYTRIVLAFIIAAGFLIRLEYLLYAVRTPGFSWSDPDGYLHNALLLITPAHTWHWTFASVRYDINGQVHALPPLYPVFLSLIALFPGMPFTALFTQVLLSTASIGIVYLLGRIIHSPSAGLWAAGGFALSVSNIFSVWSTSQETVYVPLLLVAFTLLARAVTKNASSVAFAVAGLALGLAALSRSMPLFFVLPAAVAHVAMATNRRRAIRQSAAFIAGFALLVVPYCVGLSSNLGRVAVIDTHGSIHVAAEPLGGQAPGLGATAAALWHAVAGAPGAFLRDSGSRARSLLYVNGGRQLQIYVAARNRVSALAWKVLVHLGTDALLIAATLFAAFGIVLCRNTRVGVLILLWTAINVAIASFGGFGGARLRAPFEPLLVVLGAVVLAGAWRRRPPAAIAIAGVASLLLATVVLPQVPQSLRAWPDYGVSWDSVLVRKVGHVTGTAALNVPAYAGTGELLLRADGADPSVTVIVRPAGGRAITVPLGSRDQRVAWDWPPRGLAYVEVRASDLRTGSPAAVTVMLPDR